MLCIMATLKKKKKKISQNNWENDFTWKQIKPSTVLTCKTSALGSVVSCCTTVKSEFKLKIYLHILVSFNCQLTVADFSFCNYIQTIALISPKIVTFGTLSFSWLDHFCHTAENLLQTFQQPGCNIAYHCMVLQHELAFTTSDLKWISKHFVQK